MRRLGVVLLVAALGATGLAPASGQEPERRIEEGTYASPAPGSNNQGSGLTACMNQDAPGCVQLPGGPETFINVAIADATGEPVAGRITQFYDGSRTTHAQFCTTTVESVGIVANVPVDIIMWPGQCEDGTPTSASNGTVTGSFTSEAEPNPLVEGGEPEPEPSTDPEPEPEPSTDPQPEPEPGPEKDLDGPGVRLRFSSRTPEKGGTFRAKALLLKCKGHAGTNIQIRRKKHGTFEKVATGKLDRNCTARFKLRSNFSKATFRAVWPSQDKDHRAGRSAAKIVVPR